MATGDGLPRPAPGPRPGDPDGGQPYQLEDHLLLALPAKRADRLPPVALAQADDGNGDGRQPRRPPLVDTATGRDGLARHRHRLAGQQEKAPGLGDLSLWGPDPLCLHLLPAGLLHRPAGDVRPLVLVADAGLMAAPQLVAKRP